MANSLQTVICIPGQWPTRSDIVTSIASRSDGYLFAGRVVMKIGTKEGFGLEAREHDSKLKDAFSIAGFGRLTEEDLTAIGLHTFCLYLGAPGGSVETAKKLLHTANGLLKSGGLAVKIESTGIAHRADQWAEFCALRFFGYPFASVCNLHRQHGRLLLMRHAQSGSPRCCRGS